MSSNLEIEWILGILISISVICGTAYGIIRKIYCVGKADEAKDNKIKVLEEALDSTNKDLELLKTDIHEYRSKTEKKLDELIHNQEEIKSSIDTVQGYLEGKFGKTKAKP